MAPPIRPLAKTLIVLNLAMNNITYIPPEYFRGFHLLGRVFLHHNSITYLPEMHFLNKSLTQLRLSWNRLDDIKTLYLVSYDKLKTLVSKHNFLTNLSFENAMWPAMEFVDLHYNLFSTINPFQRTTKGTTQIKLSYNPLHCNRDLCWLAKCTGKQMNHDTVKVLVCSPYPRMKVIYLGLTCNSPVERNMTGIFESGTAQNKDVM